MVGTSVVPAAAGAASRRPPLETVCHAGDDGEFRALDLPAPAAAAHRAHGDPEPGDVVPGVAGQVFDEDCRPVTTAPDTDGDGTPDLEEAVVCISMDGVLVHRVGAATCRSSIGAFAYAEGVGADARADGGDGNRAVAVGDGARAITGLGLHNAALAFGPGASAQAGVGDGNHAEARGNRASATAAFGDGNRAVADGDHTTAYAAATGGCTAMATSVAPSASCP